MADEFRKLTYDDVLLIKWALYHTGPLEWGKSRLARTFNVSLTTIRRIHQGDSWKHVEIPKADAYTIEDLEGYAA